MFDGVQKRRHVRSGHAYRPERPEICEGATSSQETAPFERLAPPTPPKLGITFVKWYKGFLVSVDVTLAYMPRFRTELRVDEDIKAQIASLMRKQKERDAERARSSSAESRGSTAGPSGKRASDEFEQNVEKRVSGK